MKKVVHIITGLNMGGTEKMLYNVVANSDKRKYTHSVISMMDKGYYGSMLEELGIKVFCLNMGRGIPRLSSIWGGRSICKNSDIIQTWMYHADFFGTLIKILLPDKKLIWGVRQSDVNSKKDTRSTMLMASINSRLSRVPDIIVCNSRIGIRNHIRLGYKQSKMRYVPNGIDTDLFYKRQETLTLDENLIGDKSFIICSVGRWDIQKGYTTLIKALSEVKKFRNNFKLIMCGYQITEDNTILVNLIKEAGVTENIKLLGPRTEVYQILSKANIFILPSIGEGFSNALGEAMACELPCIVTDVGDSAAVLGDCGWVVAPGDSEAIATAIIRAMKTDLVDLHALGVSARDRIEKNFGLKNSVKMFESIYEEVTGLTNFNQQ